MSKVILQGYIVVDDNDLALVIDALAIHIELTRSEPGCIVFQVTQNKDDKNRFTVYEEFVDQSAFNAHQARVKQSNWAIVTKSVERHYQISHEN